MNRTGDRTGPRRRPRSTRSRFWLSYLYAGIGLLLLVAAFGMLYPVRHTEGFATAVRINVGSNLLDLVLAALVLQPLILYFSRNAVRWRNSLDYPGARLLPGGRLAVVRPRPRPQGE